MLPKKLRVHRKEFLSGKKPTIFWYGTILCGSRAPATKNMFTVVVHKKYGKNAVARNKFRRLVYTAIATHLRNKSINGNWKYVFSPTKNIKEISKEDIKIEINRLLGRSYPVSQHNKFNINTNKNKQ